MNESGVELGAVYQQQRERLLGATASSEEKYQAPLLVDGLASALSNMSEESEVIPAEDEAESAPALGSTPSTSSSIFFTLTSATDSLQIIQPTNPPVTPSF